MTWITTATVLHKLRDFENHAAWDSFAERFRTPVVNFARGMGLKPSDAEDVAQETLLAFAQAYREGKYNPDRGRLSQYLFGIAYRQSLKARRSVPAIAESGELSQIPDEQTATGIWDTEWERSVLQRCLAQVQIEFEPQTYRAFDLTVREEQDPAVAAEAVGISVKSVYNAKHRILKRIRELRSEFEQHE